ncbi:MAG: amidohydrolase family protein [Gemmatimonadetes bacterium]|nr:amidohydrolase family protein [Gemmatimonadota bacterium]
MRVIASFLLLPLALSAAAAQAPSFSENVRPYVAVDAPVVALTHVKLIDGTGAAPAENQTIVIAGGKIQAVGANVAVPAGAKVMDLTGHTVTPGFVGLHNHTFYTTAAGRRVQLNFSAPRLYLASGVTTIRTTGSISPYSEITLKSQIDSGAVPGPRMYITGPYITGPDATMERAHVRTPEAARRVVSYWTEEGVTWFKVYTGITRAELAAVADEAHQRGAKVTGHLCSVGFREAVAAGIDGLEHGLMANSEFDPEKKPDECPRGFARVNSELDLNQPEVRASTKEVVDHQIPITTTLAVYEASVPNRPPLAQRMLDALAPDVREEVLTARARVAQNNNPLAARMLRKEMDFDLAFVKAGGLLGAGVDPTGNGGALPGFGDQRNYPLLLEAGFTAPQAIQIMSANGAKVLGAADRFGTVTPGKLADLVVIQGDPVATPADIEKVTLVFKEGVGYDSAKLIEVVKGMVGVR